MTYYLFFKSSSNPTSLAAINLSIPSSCSTPLASVLWGLLPATVMEESLTILESQESPSPWFTEGAQLTHCTEGHECYPSAFVHTGHAPLHNPTENSMWNRWAEQARTRRWGSPEDPWPDRAGPNFLWLGFAHGPGIFQRPSALILPGQRIPSAFMSPWREEFHHGGKGKWWGSLALNHRQEAGRTGETESDQLPSTAWVAVRGRKETTGILNCHTCSCLLWFFSRK